MTLDSVLTSGYNLGQDTDDSVTATPDLNQNFAQPYILLQNKHRSLQSYF